MIEKLENLKFLGFETKINGKKHISWFVADDIKEFVEMIAYEELPVYYHDFFDDLQYDLINDKELEGFIDRVCELTGEESPMYKSLVALKKDLLNAVNNPTVEMFKVLLDNFNKQLQLNQENSQYLYFDNINGAYEYLKNNYDIENQSTKLFN